MKSLTLMHRWVRGKNMNIHYDEKIKSYWARITLRYNNKGKRVQRKVKPKTKRDLQAEVGRWVKRFEDGFFDEIERKDEALKFSDVALEWQKEHVEELAVNTLNSYNSRLNRILAKFRDYAIKDITTRDI
ncbi:hypothetical protein LPB41_23990 [Thalassospira sp. MA62]|nr:hypothetical protein [Thalassospira sp. MA62]